MPEIALPQNTLVSDDSFLGDFINSLPPLTQAPPDPEKKRQPEPEPKKEFDDGTTRPNPTDKVEPKPGAVAEPKPADKTPDPRTEELPAVAPKNQKEWEAWKTKRKASEDQLRTELTTRETRLKEVETKLAEATAKASAKPAVDPELKNQLEAANKRIEELDKALILSNVEQHPKFKAHYDGRVNDQIATAKEIVGAELADRTEKILKMPDGEWKQAKLDELRTELSEGQREDLAVVRGELKKIAKDKSDAIKASFADKEKESADQASAAQRGEAELISKVDQAVAAAEDPKTGFVFYQKKDGDEDWNKGVDRRKAAVRELLTAKNIDPRIIAKSAFFAVAVPDIIARWTTDMKTLTAERDTLVEQVKKLTAAQPAKGGTTSPGDGGRTKPNPKATPGDHMDRLISTMMKE